MSEDCIDSMLIYVCVEDLTLEEVVKVKERFTAAHIAARPATQKPYASIEVALVSLMESVSWLNENLVSGIHSAFISLRIESNLGWGSFFVPPDLLSTATHFKLPIEVGFSTVPKGNLTSH